MSKKIRYLLIIFLLILIVGMFAKSKLYIKETENIEGKDTVSNIINSTSSEQNIIKNEISVSSSKKNTISKENNKSETAKDNTQLEEVFTSSEIPNSVLKKMIGNSIPDKDKVDIRQLSYLKITYWGFDEKTHVGEMIVNKDVAQEVLDIFQEVYHKKYPIEKIKLIDEYDADDGKSMEDNNTSAFCYRKIANTNKLSNHSLGKAIDINPLYNPYTFGNIVSPAEGKKYSDRSIVRKGTIKKGDALYNAFIKRGWTWGGDWSSKKDYQHFEKRN